MASRKRPADFDLREAIKRPEFTPAGTDAEALVSLLAAGEDRVAKDATNALLRIPDKALAEARKRIATAGHLEATELVELVAVARFLGRLAPDEVRGDLLTLLGHGESRVRRAATSALGRIGGDGVEAALLERFPAVDPAETRALATALGKVGTERSAEALAAIDPGDDAELAKIVERARLMRARDAARTTTGSIRTDVAPMAPLAMEFACREGLEPLLLDELLEIRGVRDARIVGRGIVAAKSAVSLDALAASRIATDYAFSLEDVRITQGDEVGAVARLLDARIARDVMERFTEGVPRIRIDFPGMGPRRAFVWDVASALAARGIVNDARDALWEARIRFGSDGFVRGRLVPRGRVDSRFDYRKGDVPAASHPTIAAAIARMAGVRDDDVVWDPFVGSGQELVECAKLGPVAMLLGTDLDERALAVSRENLDAAGLEATLTLADATTFVPPRKVSLIVSNPPMGRRVHRGDVGPLLVRWLEHVAQVLAPDGRLVFVSPLPRVTGEALERIGFVVERALLVDMGGFDARLERWRRA